MDQKSESMSMQGRLAWIISAWYLFVLWSWSVPLYGRNEELFAISLVIMLSGIFLAVISFARFLYELRKSALQQVPPDNDFIIRVLIDLGALTVLSRFSVTMNRLAEGLDSDAVLLLVTGIIMLTLIYGLVRVLIGVSLIRGYLAARWRAAVATALALAIISTLPDMLRALHLALAAAGVEQAANAMPADMALDALWYDGYSFFLALLAAFLVMLATAWRQFAMVYADIGRLVARLVSGFKKPQSSQKPKVAEPAAIRSPRVAVKRR
jgi:hypothetical protein